MQKVLEKLIGLFLVILELEEIIDYGNVADHKFATGAPKVVPDCNRRSLLREEWIDEFFDTKTDPKGHGFNLVDQSISGFACYSFIPKVDVPIKVIVLDNTQSETDGSTDIHGHGFLDKPRWDWLKAELAAGQEANQLMIIAAHIPICVSSIGSETEWWADESNVEKNAVSLKEFVGTLQDTPNLLMWIAGHRHLNTVKAFISPNPNKPWQGFWQVETSSLRDFPQQFRTFEIYLNSDYTISIVTINVDPAVAPGTPAATSRKYAIAAQQIVKNVLILNNPNCSTVNDIPVPSMDTTRLQSGNLSKSDPHCDPDPLLKTDPTIQFVDLSKQGVPYNASYNAELFKQLSPEMAGILKAQYPLIKHSYPE